MARRLVFIAVAALALAVLAAALYGALVWRHPTDISIDLTQSLDHRVVYPMARETAIITDPGRIDLRLPNGQEYHEDGAFEVWISRTDEGSRNLIRQVSINTLFDTADQAYARAYRFQKDWGMTRGPVLDQWYERRKLEPYERFVTPVLGEHRFTGVYVSGRPFSASFELRSSTGPGQRYQVLEEFNWGYV